MARNQVQSDRQMQIVERMPGKCKEKTMKMKKKEKLSLVPYFNDDIIWCILSRVPATSLVANCRFQCKQWSDLFCNQNFLKAHFLESKSGILLIEHPIEGKDVKAMKFMEFKETEIGKVHNLHTLKKTEIIMSICAGLCIVLDLYGNNTRVMNPLTKESIQLPRLGRYDIWREILFDQATMNYKIAVFSRKFIGERGVSKLTLGGLGGTCRRIKGAKNFLLKQPAIINGVLYCTAKEKGLWCFDLSSERTRLLKWPIKDMDPEIRFQILDIGGSIGFVMIGVEINIWILRQHKWVQICCVDREQVLVGQPGYYDYPPKCVGCLGSELFVFTDQYCRIDAYNVKTKQWMTITPADIDPGNYRFEIHVSSILPLTSKVFS